MADRDEGRGSAEARENAADGNEIEPVEGHAGDADEAPLGSWAALADLDDAADGESGGLLGLDDALLQRLAAEAPRSGRAGDPFEGSLAAPNAEAWLDEADSLRPSAELDDEGGTDDILARNDISELIDLDDLMLDPGLEPAPEPSLDPDEAAPAAATPSAVSAPSAAVAASVEAPPGDPDEAPEAADVVLEDTDDELDDADVEFLDGDAIEVIEAEGVVAPAASQRAAPPPVPAAASAPSGGRQVVALGAVPEAAAIERPEWWPEGAPPHPDWSWGEGAGVTADLPIPTSDAPEAARFQRLLKRLRHEIRAEADPARLAALCHTFSVVAQRWLGDDAVGLEAARTAWINDPTLAPARWQLDALLGSKGDLEGRLTVLERGDAAALTRAGHLAVAGTPQRALDDWGWAAEYDRTALAPMLAALLVLYADPALGSPLPTLDWALQRATHAGLWDALGLEHVRLSTEADPAEAGAAWIRALDQLGYSPGLSASTQARALDHGDWALLEATARRGLAQADLDAPSRRQLGFARAWGLERLGQAEAATAAFDDLLVEGDPIAGIMGDAARAAGDVEREGRALSAEADARPAGPWRAASLVARAQLAERTDDRIAAVAAWRSALSADPACVPALAALDRRARARGDLISVQDRAADEIDALEARLATADKHTAVHLERRLVTRYYRLARLLETELQAPDVALDYHKRALGLAPDFAPALLALERMFATREDWPALSALYLGRAARGAGSPASQAPWLLAAADVARIHQGDDARAAKLYLRALKAAPNDASALVGAADALIATGDIARAAVVVERMSSGATGPAAAELLVRAASLHEAGGVARAEASALALYEAALRAAPAHVGALDGVLRLALRTGTLAPIRALAKQPAKLGALVALQVAEALMAAGQVAEAATFAGAWRGARGAGDTPRAVDASLRVIEERAADENGDWEAVVTALEGRAGHAQPETRAVLLARAGELREFRLGDPPGALAAYDAALGADPACVAARTGLGRLGPAVAAGHAGGPWWVRAGAAPSFEARASILETEAGLTDDPDEAAALRTVAGQPEGTSLEGRLSAGTLVEPDARSAALDAYLTAVRAGDAEATAHAIEGLDGTVAHVARWRGAVDAARQRAAGALAETLNAPLWSAGARGDAVPEDAADLDQLEALVRLTPDDDARILRLAEATLQAEDWPRLARVYGMQLEAAPPSARLSVARSLAALQAERFEDPSAAFETLSGAAAEGGAGIENDLRIAQYAERAGRTDDADTWFARAEGHPDATDRTYADHARAIEARDDPQGAIACLEAAVEAMGETCLLMERLAELRARLRDWRGVVRALLRLVELEPEASAQARRAMAIARIMSRVTGDHRRAVGWYKRAIELDPAQLVAVWHMLAEAEHLPPAEVPQAHIDDALQRARAAQLDRLADAPTDPEGLKALHRLALAAGDAEAAGLAAEALVLLGADEPGLGEGVAARRRRGLPAGIGVLSPARRGALAAGGTDDAASAMHSAFAEALVPLLTSPPQGDAADAGQIVDVALTLGDALGVEGLEVWLGEGADGYAPHPVLVLSTAAALAPLEPGLVYDVARRLDALRGGHGVLAGLDEAEIVALFDTLALHLGARHASEAPGPSCPVSPDAVAVLPVPPGLTAHVDALVSRAGHPPDAGAYLASEAATSRRVGLVFGGSLAAALAVHCGELPAPEALAARLDEDAGARDLLLFAVDPICAATRRALGLTEEA